MLLVYIHVRSLITIQCVMSLYSCYELKFYATCFACLRTMLLVFVLLTLIWAYSDVRKFNFCIPDIDMVLIL